MLRYEDAVKFFYRLVMLYDGREKPELPVRTVNNGRDYDGYFSQLGSGKYASVNCMPAITAMALKWWNPESTETPESLRKHYPDNTGGWYLRILKETPAMEEVPFQVRDYGVDNIIQDLDNGGIVLLQFSAGRLEQGHCQMLFGYEQRGEGLEFLACDSDTLPLQGRIQSSGIRRSGWNGGWSAGFPSSSMWRYSVDVCDAGLSKCYILISLLFLHLL